MANHLIDSVDQRGLEVLGRFARMALRGGGRLYADFDALAPGERPWRGRREITRPRDVGRVARTLEARVRLSCSRPRCLLDRQPVSRIDQ